MTMMRGKCLLQKLALCLSNDSQSQQIRRIFVTRRKNGRGNRIDMRQARQCAVVVCAKEFHSNRSILQLPKVGKCAIAASSGNTISRTMNGNSTPRVLSIQSHVVSGYVGNKSATFPLQLLGFEVDVINSVQLSNHTGYKVFKGQVLNEEDLSKCQKENDICQLVDGLAENDLDDYTHLLTGYSRSASFLRRIAQLVKNLKQKNPKLIYVCDPVMGDNGHMYVPQELKDIYQKEIVPLANIVTPNQFELELLTGKKVDTAAALKDAIQELHKVGPKIVAVSSCDIDDKLTSVTSTAKDNQMIKIEVPKIPASYTGSGDLFAALFLAHCYLTDDIKSSLENTINSLHDVLLKTYEHSQGLKDPKIQRARKIELRLIQSKKIIENPSKKLQATSF